MDVFDLSAKLKLDKSDYESGLKNAESSLSSFGSKLKSGIGTAAKVVGAGVTAAAGAVATLAKSAVSAYGAYQQLEGGIQTLFGNDAQTMMKKAEKAYKTAGVSANQYMEMAIQSSAAMITSLEGDTAKAAEMMDMSIIDMSDNVNKMGTTMEAVQNAYRGFSRGNFTMLDNLALGYAGTKKGMQELLERANEINKAHGVMSEYAIDSYSDIVQAIHVVQTEMGITGTTSKEAADTITGSAGSAKAAWEDLKVAIASGDDSSLTKSLDNLIASVTTMAKNIIPIFERSIKGIGQLIEKVAPVISERLPGLIEEILPGLISAATSLITGLVKALPGIIKTLIKQIPTITKEIVKAIKDTLPLIFDAGKELITELSGGINADAGGVIDTILTIINNLINSFSENYPKFLDAGLAILGNVIDGIVNKMPDITDTIGNLLVSLIELIGNKLPDLLIKGEEIIAKLIEGIGNNLPKLITKIADGLKDFIAKIGEKLPEILAKGGEIISNLVSGIGKAIPEIIAKVPEIVDALINNLLSTENIDSFLDTGFKIIENILNGLFDGDFGQTMEDVIYFLLSAVEKIWDLIGEIGARIVYYILEGIKKAWHLITEWVGNSIQGLVDGINDKVAKATQDAATYTDEYYENLRQKALQRQAERNNTAGSDYAGSSSYAKTAQQNGGYNTNSNFASSDSMAKIYNKVVIGGTEAKSANQQIERENSSRGGNH